MKKHKLFFLAGVGFTIALLVVSVQLIRAQGTNTWSPPLQPFPQGNTYPPLDTSSNTQTKLGGLILGTDLGKYSAISFPENRIIQSGNNTLTLNASGNTTLYSPNLFYISTDGLVLPTKTSNPTSNAVGTIYYNTISKTVKLNTDGTLSGWVDIGTGTVTGGTAVGWLRNNTSGFVYLTTSTDKVGIGTNAPQEKLSLFGSDSTSRPINFHIGGTEQWIANNAYYAPSASVWKYSNGGPAYGIAFRSGAMTISAAEDKEAGKTITWKNGISVKPNGEVCIGDPAIAANCRTSWPIGGGAGGGWTAEAGKVYVTNVGDKVGIGTTNPQFSLTVSSTVDSVFGLFRSGGTVPTIFKLGTDNAFVINNDNKDILTLKNGKIGIGTDNPIGILDVVSNSGDIHLKRGALGGSVNIGFGGLVGLNLSGDLKLDYFSTGSGTFYDSSGQLNESAGNLVDGIIGKFFEKVSLDWWNEPYKSKRLICDTSYEKVDCVSGSQSASIVGDTKYDLNIGFERKNTLVNGTNCSVQPTAYTESVYFCYNYRPLAQKYVSKSVSGSVYGGDLIVSKLKDGMGSGKVLSTDADGRFALVTGGAGKATWAGATSDKYTGNMGGYKGANDKCNAKFTGSHMCSQEDIFDVIDGGTYPSGGEGWIRGGIFGSGAVKGSDCEGFTTPASDTNARTWEFTDKGGRGWFRQCNSSFGIFCCK